jgi:hypothetical protein
MQSIKRIEPKLAKEFGTFSRTRLRNYHLVGEGQQHSNVAPPVYIRIPIDLNLQSGAADPRRKSRAYHAKNGLNSFGFFADTRLTLIVSQAV